MKISIIRLLPVKIAIIMRMNTITLNTALTVVRVELFCEP